MKNVGENRKEAISKGFIFYYGNCKTHGKRTIRRVCSFICVECGKINDEKWRQNNLDAVKYNHKKWVKNNHIKIMLSYARKRAKRNNLPYDLKEKDIIIPEVCPILGIKLERQLENTVKYNSPSIDRIINENGYVKDNIVIISHRANRIKSDATISELKMIVAFYESKERRK